jgi:hypothetical protein
MGKKILKHNMKKILILLIVLCSGNIFAQQTPVTKANYDLAERFSPKKIGQMVFSTNIRPNWFEKSNKFWYSYKTPKGEEYYIVDPINKSKKQIWDMGKLAAQISEITKDPFDAQHLPIKKLKLKEDKYFEFEIESSLMVPKKEKKIKEKRRKNLQKKRKRNLDLGGILILKPSQI